MAKTRYLILFSLIFIFTGLFAAKPIPADSSTIAEPKTFLFKPVIGVGIGSFSFIGDVHNTRKLQVVGASRFGYDLSIGQNFNNYLNIRFYYLTGKVSANEKSLTRNLNFESVIHLGGVNLSYNFDHFLPYHRAVEPYVTLGIETFEYLSKTDLFDKNGNTYHYWSDGSIRSMDEQDPNAKKAILLKRDYVFESDIRETNTDKLTKKYPERSFSIPIGVGANFKLTEKLNFKVGVTLHNTFTDNVDGITNKSLGVRKGNRGRDKFLFSSFCITYDLTRKKDLTAYEDELVNNHFLAMGDDDTDGDGVIDFIDSAAATPKGVIVTMKGVPLDEDKDHIPDYRDKENSSKEGAIVNEHGVEITDKMAENTYSMYLDSTGAFQKIKLEKRKDTGSGISAGFRVKLGAYKTGVPSDLISKFLSMRDIKSDMEDSLTIYTVGNYTNYSAAKERKNETIEKGITGATIVFYKDGKYSKVDDNNAAQFENELKKVYAGGSISPPSISNTNTSSTPYSGNNNTSAKGTAAPVETNGVIYRVQLGAFKKEASKANFAKIPDVIFIKSGDITRVLMGNYTKYEDAAKARIDMIVKDFDGAFIVAFKNGERVSLKSTGVQILPSVKEEVPTPNDNTSEPSSKTTKENNAVKNTPENKTETPENINKPINNPKKETAPETISPDKKSENKDLNDKPKSSTEKPNNAATIKTENPTKTAAEVEFASTDGLKKKTINGLVFKVQLGVFKGEVPADIKAKYAKLTTKINISKTEDGLTRYSVGHYDEYQPALLEKNEITLHMGIKDAFVIALLNGKQIDVKEARNMLK